MYEITVGRLADADLMAASKQIAISYKAAYRNWMTNEYLSSLPETHWVEILRTGLKTGDTCLIARCAGAIVGSAVFGCGEFDAAENYAAFHAIYVLPDYIGHGVGHRLYDRVEREMRAQGYDGCYLEALSVNQRAIAFYQSHGFKQVNSFMVEENGMTLPCDTMKKAWYRTRKRGIPHD